MSTKSTLKAIPMALAIASALALGGLAQAQTGGAGGVKGAAGEGQTTTMPAGSGMGGSGMSGSGTTGMGMSGSQATTPPGTTKPKDDLASPAPIAGSAANSGMSGSGMSGSKTTNLPGSTKPKDRLVTPEPTAGSAAKSSKGQAEPKTKAKESTSY